MDSKANSAEGCWFWPLTEAIVGADALERWNRRAEQSTGQAQP